MIKKNGENFKVMKHLLNDGPLTAAGACQSYISNNLRSRVAELHKMGFKIASTQVEGKKHNKYFIASYELELNRELFGRHIRG